jgi:hypothetical protein
MRHHLASPKTPTLVDETWARGSLKHLKSRDAFFRECWARSCESQHAARLRAVRNERRARSSSVARLKPDRMLERCS